MLCQCRMWPRQPLSVLLRDAAARCERLRDEAAHVAHVGASYLRPPPPPPRTAVAATATVCTRHVHAWDAIGARDESGGGTYARCDAEDGGGGNSPAASTSICSAAGRGRGCGRPPAPPNTGDDGGGRGDVCRPRTGGATDNGCRISSALEALSRQRIGADEPVVVACDTRTAP